MASVWLRVLDGPDRGAVFADLPTPVTVGREEGNHVQIRDERVSRYHLKIQEDQGRIILTDLQSTNGTRVNGETVQIWQLRPGDIIQIGRTVILFGAPDEIARRLAELRGAISSGSTFSALADAEELDSTEMLRRLHAEFVAGSVPEDYAPLHLLLPPELPYGLTPGQAAQVAELLQYIHLRLRTVVRTVIPTAQGSRVTLDQRAWQNLLDLYGQIGAYLRQIGEPEDALGDESP
jgi:pSer/pThr/pTyr-binding forkhead associated (FHA) protein